MAIPLFACRRCGNSGKARYLTLDGKTLATLHACDTCVTNVSSTLATVKPVFDAMITAGVDRALANDTMIFLLDRMPP